MSVTDDQRAVTGDVIDVRIAVQIGDGAAVALANENRRSADGLESAHGRRNAARHDGGSFGEGGFGIGRGTHR